MRIRDGSTVLFQTKPAPRAAIRSIEVRAGGRTWRVEAGAIVPPARNAHRWILAFGLLLALAVALLFWRAFRHERTVIDASNALAAAERRTAALQELTSRLSLAHTTADVAASGLDGAVARVGAAAGVVELVSRNRSRLVRLTTIGLEPDEMGDLVALEGDRMLAFALETSSSTTVSLDSSEWPEWVDGSAIGTRFASAALLPLRVEERTLGIIVLLFDVDDPTSAQDRHDLEATASQTAQALERARLSDTEHELADALQRSLLPRRLPQLAGLTVAVRYRPATQEARVGGDWYDEFTLPGGRIGLVVGDVVGHGSRSAAAMGQLRSALAAFAMAGDAPSVVLRSLDTFAANVDGAEGSTVVYAILDPEHRRLSYARAGHLPPILVREDGSAALLDQGGGQPLGFGFGGNLVDASVTLDGAYTIVLYSDGAIERPGEPLDVGLDRLATLAAASAHDPEALCERVLGEIALERDDVALLAARWTSS